MESEEQLARLAPVIAKQEANIGLLTRARVVDDKVLSEQLRRCETLNEERDELLRENARLHGMIARLERDLKLAQRMARPRGKR